MTTMKRTVLVVDDSEICREMVRYILTSRGYDVVTVDSPFSFGAALSRSQPDLVLVDAQMPALQGDKLVAVAIQNGLCSCPIVFHSDRPAEELQALVKSSGAAGFIRKTNDADDFVMAVEDYLAGSKKPDSSRMSREVGPVSQRFGAPSTRLTESGVYSSSGPTSSRMRGSQKP